MTNKELADILAATTWPATVLVICLVFRRHLVALLQALTIKTIKLKLLGAEIELTAEQADRALNELIQEVVESARGLSESELQLFEKIHEVHGSVTLQELVPGFTRKSEAHEQLRRLRSMKLIRPNEGGRWETNKHPITTRFAEIFIKLRNEGHRIKKS